VASGRQSAFSPNVWTPPPRTVVRPPSRRPAGGPPSMRLSNTFKTWRGAMNRVFKTSFLLFALVLSGALATPPAGAQTVTTGAISGVVTDESGGVLPGATVEAVHEPTGTRYTAVTTTDGRFSILHVRVGGPYDVSVKLSGFKDQAVGGLNVALGSELSVPVKMKLQTVSETVEVVGEAGSIINPTATGPTA